jgi:hypothetical protein
MKCWKVTVYNRTQLREECFVVQAEHGRAEIVKILAEVHPEYEKISVKSIKRPKGIKEWKTA